MEYAQQRETEDTFFLCIGLFISLSLTFARHLCPSPTLPRAISNQAVASSDSTLIVSSPLRERIARLPVLAD